MNRRLPAFGWELDIDALREDAEVVEHHDLPATLPQLSGHMEQDEVPPREAAKNASSRYVLTHLVCYKWHRTSRPSSPSVHIHPLRRNGPRHADQVRWTFFAGELVAVWAGVPGLGVVLLGAWSGCFSGVGVWDCST